jgi:hypothetical protein
MIQLDDRTAALLEQIAPGKSRKRSEFLRGAISRVLQETLEVSTRKAYAKWPDDAPLLLAADWASAAEVIRPPARRKRRARSPGAKR